LTYGWPDRHEKLECVRSAVHAIYRTWELFGVSMGSCGADDFMPVFTYALPRNVWFGVFKGGLLENGIRVGGGWFLGLHDVL
jgi:hypothetical protein